MMKYWGFRSFRQCFLDLFSGTARGFRTKFGLRKRMTAATSVEVERARIAGELHDSVGHRLVIIAMQVRHLSVQVPELRTSLGIIDESATEALAEIREIVGTLKRVSSTDSSGELAGDIGKIVSRIPDGALSVSMETVGAERPVPEGERRVALRVVEEGLTNAIKHVGEGVVRVTLGYHPLTVAVRSSAGAPRRSRVSDGGGYGLPGLRDRVTRSGGELEHGSTGDGGFVLRAAFPVARTGT
ncbi:sensor histidine kinase [Amycolatopsis thailandensis]|uniref:sensor histidine kinase n=1 Tax=Amycolatopsis thailandensis TaxID=589330 RepID=UPI00366008F2